MSASVPYSPDPHPAGTLPSDTVIPARVAGAPEPAERAAWWLALGAAVLGVVVGVMMMAWPDATLKVVAALFGAWLLLHGVMRLVQAITGTALGGGERAILGVIGVFFVVAGVVALRNLLVSLALVITVVGLMWLIGGILELISAFGSAARGDRLWHVVLGALSVIAAIVVLVWPDLSLTTLVYVTGVWLIVMGLIQVAMVFAARRALTA